ncbi:glycosyltransferase [Phaeobacter sp. HF9A]|nr:alpha-2,3-sialyltransferase [Phaeobacter sp. HF9A]NIZ13225.1 glycosyltransferase [Phaeobacter sp. HF9A]
MIFKNQAVVIVGNGPSSKDNAMAFQDIKEPAHVARMNFFMLEEGLPYGRAVDSYFWAVNRQALHETLRSTVDSGRYAFDAFYSSVPIDRMDYDHGKVKDDPFFPDDKLFDHWRVIGQCDPLGRRMMSRPLPTLGVQALATFAVMGVKRAYLFGLDFYQSADSRYAFTIPEDLARTLGDTHTTPGYEAGAHSLEADLEFLQTIIKEFPDFEIVNHTHFRDLDDMVKGKRLARKFAINALPEGQAPSPVSVPAVTADASDPAALAISVEVGATLGRMQVQIKALEAKLAGFKDQKLDIERMNRLFDLISLDGLPHSDVVWVVHEMQSFAGVYRPLQTYLDVSNQKLHLRPKVINLSDRDRRRVRMTIDHVTAGPFRLVLNSIASFSDTRVQRLIDEADEIAIYLHETEWTMEGYRQKQPLGYYRFLNCVSRATVMCVSPAQEAYVQKAFAPKATELVYNTVDTILPPEARRMNRIARSDRDPGRSLCIGMVGSYQSRKGTELFTQVARMVGGTKMSFEWVGKQSEGLVDRDAITFHGAKPPAEAQEFIADLDVMFIPSRDDPQPLAALEAASRGVKLVCYAGIGTAEWVRDIPGCAVFDDYTPEAALAALEQALNTPLDFDRVDAVLRDRFDTEVFARRLKDAIDGMRSESEFEAAESPEATRGLKLLKSRTRTVVDRLRGAAPRQSWDQVLTACQRLIDRPEDTVVYARVARQLVEMGEQTLADKAILASVENNPEKASARREAAIHFFNTGRLDTAHAFAIEATQSNPESASAQRILEKIEAQLGPQKAAE